MCATITAQIKHPVVCGKEEGTKFIIEKDSYYVGAIRYIEANALQAIVHIGQRKATEKKG